MRHIFLSYQVEVSFVKNILKFSPPKSENQFSTDKSAKLWLSSACSGTHQLYIVISGLEDRISEAGGAGPISNSHLSVNGGTIAIAAASSSSGIQPSLSHHHSQTLSATLGLSGKLKCNFVLSNCHVAVHVVHPQ